MDDYADGMRLKNILSHCNLRVSSQFSARWIAARVEGGYLWTTSQHS